MKNTDSGLCNKAIAVLLLLAIGLACALKNERLNDALQNLEAER